MFCGTYPLATTLWKANLIKETLQICIRSGWKGNNSNHESLGPHDDEQATNPSQVIPNLVFKLIIIFSYNKSKKNYTLILFLKIIGFNNKINKKFYA